MQIADIRYTSKEAFAGSALHILHRGTNYIVYIATAQETGLKLLLKAYDTSKQFPQHSTCPEHAYVPAATACLYTMQCSCRIVLASLCSCLPMWCYEHLLP